MRILLVDDDPAYRTLLATALRARGHLVQESASPAGICIRLVGRAPDLPDTRPDVAVLDFCLPGMSCEALLDVMASDAAASTVPVVVHSAMDAAAVVPVLTKRERVHFVPKTGRLRDTITHIERAAARTLGEA